MPYPMLNKYSLWFFFGCCVLAYNCLGAENDVSQRANIPFPQDYVAQQKIDAQQQQRWQEQEKRRQQSLLEQRETKTLTSRENVLPFSAQTPCFRINSIYLTSFSPDNVALEALTVSQLKTDFDWALKAIYAPKDFNLPYCLGAKGIGEIIKRVQNAIIERGFVTTRVFVQPQDLRQERLVLTLVSGRVRQVLLRDHSDRRKAHKGTVWFALPLRQGDLLNIRDIEQGLENLKRPAHVEANIQIVPAQDSQALAGESDLHIDFKQAFPYRLALWLDDSGTKATGRLQAGASVSIENLLSLNDVLYGLWTQSIRRGSDLPERRGSRSGSVYYAIPWQNFLLTFSATQYRYYQTVFGAFQDYEYSGRSNNMSLKLSRLVYRDNVRKLSADIAIWHRVSANFIDNAEIKIQRRRMAGWAMGVNYNEYIGSAIVEFTLNYKQGTGAYHALPAPEEKFGEGSSRPRIISSALSFKQPFQLGQQPWQFLTRWQAQWNKTPLILQDMFSIGGRYSVRGFDGELTLTGERGWVWRNELGWNVMNKGQELYLALDTGHVSGNYTKEWLGKNLVGSALGLRGELWGFYYDYFVGIPLHKPEGFRTSAITTGFNLSYRF